MECLQVNFSFFLCFPTFASKQALQNVFSIPRLNVQTTLFKVWHLQNGTSISSTHPPVDELKILLKGDSILATPFRKGRKGNESVKLDDLKKVHQQVNYTNTILQTIAEQLNQVSTQIAEVKRTQIVNPSTSHHDGVSKPFFKTNSVPRDKMEAYQQAASSNNQHLKIISEQIKELDKSVKGKSISCIDQTCQTCQNDSSSDEDSDNESDAALRVLEGTFEESGPLTINKLH